MKTVTKKAFVIVNESATKMIIHKGWVGMRLDEHYGSGSIFDKIAKSSLRGIRYQYTTDDDDTIQFYETMKKAENAAVKILSNKNCEVSEPLKIISVKVSVSFKEETSIDFEPVLENKNEKMDAFELEISKRLKVSPIIIKKERKKNVDGYVDAKYQAAYEAWLTLTTVLS